MAGYVQGESSGLLGVAKLVNLNDDASDVAIPINRSRYIVRRVVVTDASVDLTATAATFGVYTAITEGGTAVVTTGTGLNADLVTATDTKDLTIAAGSTGERLVATTLYAHVGTAHGSAATISVYIFGDVLLNAVFASDTDPVVGRWWRGYTPLVDRWQLEDTGLTSLWQIEGSTDLWDLEGSTDEWALETGAGTHLWLLEDTDPSTPEYWLLE